VPFQSFSIQNFRNIHELQWELAPGLNVLEGDNAQGKTNLLESVYYCANLKSFRTQETESLIRHGESAARLHSSVVHEDLTYRLEISVSAEKKKILFQGKELTRRANLHQSVRVLVFTPDSTPLFRGSTSLRRRYFDHAIALHQPTYTKWLSRYQRVLAQRNQQLGGGGRGELLETYNQQWGEYALELMKMREAYLTELTPLWEKRFSELNGNKWRLQPSWEGRLWKIAPRDLETLLQVLQTSAPEESRQRRTVLGPHRDDLVVQFEGHPIREIASQGQQRLLVIALKLAEADLFQIRHQKAPTFLLDDLGSELDPYHQQLLLERLGDLQAQTILTTTQQGAYDLLQGKTFRVAQGRFV
jgi:DNA replication and repair protein RecF